MVNRGNWKLIKAYLVYRAEVVQISGESLRMDETRLRHLLEWADETPFVNALSIRPTMPKYLETARMDGRSDAFSLAYTKKILNASQQFGAWLIAYRNGYKSKFARWLDTLRASRRPVIEDKQHEAVSLDEVRAIIAAPTTQIWEERIKASAVFWFLSGIRIGAFVTLPLKAVDVKAGAVKQWPQLGVKTKFSKHSTTHLLPIPDLLEVVQSWDDKVRAVLPDGGYWFAPLSSKTGGINPDAVTIGKNRDMRARADLKKWLASVDLPYHSPHKFRHGFAVYALKESQDMADFKAVSMNLMHANMSITDGIYSILSEQDRSERISMLGVKDGKSNTDMAVLLRQLANQLENSSK